MSTVLELPELLRLLLRAGEGRVRGRRAPGLRLHGLPLRMLQKQGGVRGGAGPCGLRRRPEDHQGPDGAGGGGA